MMLHEKYRPRSLAELLGQAKAARQVRALEARGYGGRPYWISGPSGTGKTSLALILAGFVADSHWIQEIDASELTPAKLREIEQSMALYGGGAKGGRAYIVNEAHGLRRDTIRQLLVLLERLPGHVAWIFTTTRDGQDSLFDDHEDAHPLLSRCVVIPLTNQGLASIFAERAKAIAGAEGLDGRPLPAYVRLVRECHNNMRAVLQRVEAGEMMP